MKNARFLSEVSRTTVLTEQVKGAAGALSIRALEVSRWCGVLYPASYGF